MSNGKQNTSFNMSPQLSKKLSKFLAKFDYENFEEIDGERLEKSTLYRIILRRFLVEYLNEPIEEALTPAEIEGDAKYERLIFGNVVTGSTAAPAE